MWTVLRGNSFKENTTVREIMKGDIYTLPQRTKSGKDMTSGALSSAMRSRYDSDKEPHQMADQMNIQEQEDFSKENGRGDSLLYPDISGRTATRDLTAGGSAAFTQYIHGSDERNREVPQRHGVPQFGGEIPIESAIKQASFLDIYDPFQKFDDYYITSPGPGFREAAVPVVNNVCVLDNPWTYGYFNSDESQKSCLRNEPCSIRYESRETQDTSSSAVDVLSSTASSPHRYINSQGAS